MKKTWRIVPLLVMLLAALAACVSGGNRRNAFTAGTYSATVQGFPGYPAYPSPPSTISVSVEYAVDKIVSVTIIESNEREPFRTATMEHIPKAIVTHQSLNVDVVSGATFTSMAIISAVRDTFEQAGGNPRRFNDKPRIVKNPPTTLVTDVLVVGSGISGLAAAIEAAYEGVNVLVIEKLGFFGGATATSGGMIHGANSVAMQARTQDPNNVFWDDTAARFTSELQALSLGLPTPNGNADMLRQIAALSSDTIDWFIQMGVNYPAGTDALGLAGNPNRAWRGMPVSRALTPENGGRAKIQAMLNHARRQNVQLINNMKAESLIMEGSAVAGVIAHDISGAEVTIHAKKVILATGGFHNNHDLMDQYHPLVREAGFHVNRWHVPGAYGEGLIMARDNAGAAVVQIPVPISSVTGALPWGIWVTPEGRRFADESWQYGLATTASLAQHGFAYQWTIMDNTNRPANLAQSPTTFTAPTIEALVAEMGIPIAERAAFLSNMEAAIEAYNTVLRGTGNVAQLPFASPFGVNTVIATDQSTRPRHLPLADTGPYWAQKSGLFADIWGTRSGLSISLQGQVLNSSNEVIENLYAAGEVVGHTLPVQYGGSGMALTMWANQARIAGKAAGQAAK
jgi:fumarate reductase flavoprotein subunit